MNTKKCRRRHQAEKILVKAINKLFTLQMELVLFLSYQSVTNPIHHVLTLDWRHQANEWSQPTENDLSIMIALLLLFVVSALSSFPISPSHFAKTK